MYVTQHNAKDFRNLENAVISPDRSINIIFGENGQGKTNLIESIWLFTGCHSFRTRKNSQLIRENCERSMLDISFFAFDRDQTARLELTDKKNVWINGVHKDTPRRLIGEFPAVLFSPATLSIVQDGPGERRKFIDIAISLVKPNYAGILSKYIKTLSERNALLRQAASVNISSDMFFSWDAQLSALGAKILRYRFEYLDMIKKQAAENYSGITAGREKLTVRYDTFCKATDFDEQSAAQTMLNELEKIARLISDASLQAQARTKTIFHFYKQQKCPHLRLAGSAEILCPLIKISRGGYTRKNHGRKPDNPAR